jgi:hypothetical protein
MQGRGNTPRLLAYPRATGSFCRQMPDLETKPGKQPAVSGFGLLQG